MSAPAGRRERKKAVTRGLIAAAALRLFLERGYDAVGIREVAAEADVAVTTLFAHFPSKEALLFERDEDFEQRLVGAITDRAPGEPVIPVLRREILALVRHCSTAAAAPIWRIIDETPVLRHYEESMRLRHAQSLAAALAADFELERSATASQAIARFVIDAYAIGRRAADPDAAVRETFEMIDAAWQVTGPPEKRDAASH